MQMHDFNGLLAARAGQALIFPAQRGFYLTGIDLVEATVSSQLALCRLQRLIRSQNGMAETTSSHLQNLVNQYIAGRDKRACRPQTPAQQSGLGVGSAVGELGEIQTNGLRRV